MLNRNSPVLRLALLANVVFAFVGFAAAQRVFSPENRFVAPGDFTTLVFRVEADAALRLEGSAASRSGWRIVRQPDPLVLAAGEKGWIALTLEIPADAPAFAEDVVTLTLAGASARLGARTTLTVSERRALALESPENAVVGPEGFTVTLINRGNVTSRATLELRRSSEVVMTQTLELSPQEQREARFAAEQEGSYTLLLKGDDVEERRSITLTRFGAPPAREFALTAEASTALSLEKWGGALEVGGFLSDFTRLEARLDARSPRNFTLALEGDAWGAQFGGDVQDPYRLGLKARGVAGHYGSGNWSVAGALSALGGGAGGYLAGEYRAGKRGGDNEEGDWSVAGGGGFEGEALQFGLRGELSLWGVDAQFGASYHEALSALLTAEGPVGKGTLEGQLGADVWGLNPAVFTRLDYYTGAGHAYLSGRVPLAPTRPPKPGSGAAWSLGAENALGGPKGAFAFGLQASSDESFARLRHSSRPVRGWSEESRFGVRYDALGFGLDAATRWSKNGDDYVGVDAQFTYYPVSNVLTGGLELKAQTTRERLTLFGSGNWTLEERRLGLSTGAVWYGGPWRFDLASTLGYAYDEAARGDPWAVSVSLSSAYTFDVRVPETVSELAGGRRTGTIFGRVHAGGAPLPNVEVRVGSYRLLTDAAGGYRAEVEPGRYQVGLELSSLPLTHRLLGPAVVNAEVASKGESEHDFVVAQTATLQGRVLEDADADGVADTPQRGLAARILVSDAEGLPRTFLTDDGGAFLARGLLPGEATVTLLAYPTGGAPVGGTVQRLELSEGEVTPVTFLVQPARARAQNFTAAALRVRRVSAPERAPPDAAPLVQVTLQGDAEEVSVSTAQGDVRLALDGDVWTGRVTVPENAPPGVYTFTVKARRGAEEATRQSQLIIDPALPPLEVQAEGPVKPGETLLVSATPQFAATSLQMQSALGDLAFTETEPGFWSAQLEVPEGAEDEVYDLVFRAVRDDGRTYEEARKVRVLR